MFSPGDKCDLVFGGVCIFYRQFPAVIAADAADADNCCFHGHSPLETGEKWLRRDSKSFSLKIL
jgi:hypothetical protein